jgi:Immunoglobulin domain/Putative Ig domain
MKKHSLPNHTRILSLALGSLALGGLLTVGQAQPVLSDDFEGYADQTALNAAWSSTLTPLSLSTVQHQGSGSKSINQGTSANQMSYKGFSTAVATKHLYYRAYFYDGGGTKGYFEARGYSAGYGSTLVQVLAIGRFNYNGLAQNVYCGRVAYSLGSTGDGASAPVSTWFLLNAGATTGAWHKGEIVGGVDPSFNIKLRFYIDGVLGGSALEGSDKSMNFAVMGTQGTSTANYYYDSVVAEDLVMVPEVNTDPVSQTVNEGSPVTFTVGAAAGSSQNVYALNTLTYQWQFNGADIPGATTSSYTIAHTVKTANEGNYHCLVMDAYQRAKDDGTYVQSADATLTINQLASPVIDSFTMDPSSGVLNVGGTVTFTTTARGTAPLTYVWKKNGSQVASGTDSTYTIDPVAGTHAGTYTCVVHNDTPPDATSANMVLTVNNPPVLAAPPATIPIAAVCEFRMGASSSPALSATATMVQDFEAYAWSGASMMFGQPSFSGTTSASLDPTGNNYTHTTSVYPAGHISPHVLQSSWTWASGGTLRLTTQIGNTVVGNRPIISQTNRLRFDICSDKSLLVAVDVRDSSPAGAIGTSDSATATGQLEQIGMPGQTVPANTWTTLEFNPLTDPISGFQGLGNGVLDSTTGKEQLEGMWLVNNGDPYPSANNVYLDNFIVLDAHPITFTLLSGPDGATIDQYSGKVTWVPDALGPVSFQVTATDDYGLSSTQTYTVTVVPSPAKIATPISYDSVTGDVTLSGTAAPHQNFRLLSSADPAAPLSGWTVEDSNTDKTGSFSFTVLGSGPGQKRFFIVQSY